MIVWDSDLIVAKKIGLIEHGSHTQALFNCAYSEG